MHMRQLRPLRAVLHRVFHYRNTLPNSGLVSSRIPLLFFFIAISAQGQDVPLDFTHPAGFFIRQEMVRGRISKLNIGNRPYSWSEVLKALNELGRYRNQLDPFEHHLLSRFQAEFDWSTWESGISGPWRKAAWQKMLKAWDLQQGLRTPEPHLGTFASDDLHLWADWRESFLVEIINGQARPFYWDRLRIAGQWLPGISFYSDYQLYRLSQKSDSDLPLPPEHKQGFTLQDSSLPWLVWDRSYAGLIYHGPRFTIGLEKRPLQWGFSPLNPVILSAEPLAYPFATIQTSYRGFRFQSIQGALVPFDPSRRDSLVPYKRLAAHRFEWDLTPSTTIAFTEMVVYARRFLELGYLLPVNIFWSEEHNQGDRDNVLMALEGRWRNFKGWEIYGTFLWDELNWLELLKPWWGNKFIFQGGLWYVASSARWDLGGEFTLARPWVFTHDDSLLSFTSGGHPLGYRFGPNSRHFVIFYDRWLGSRGLWHLEVSRLDKGSGLGSYETDNYDLRDRTLDENTPFLLSPWNTTTSISSRIDFWFTRLWVGQLELTYEFESRDLAARLKIYFDW